MKTVFPIIALFFLFLGKESDGIVYHKATPSLNETLDKPPEFFVLEWKEGTKLSPKKTDFFIEIDSIGKQDIVVLLNKNDEPVLYTSEISTPVCADGECKLMNIKLYWTLLGEYAGFDRYPDLPLTKHDHDEFLKEDYQKLHELLLDDKSILERRSIDRLVEKPVMRTVNGVDALSGATITEVKESVVSGALYSCYTAWHLVHGDVREQLKEHSLSILNENMLVHMLFSKNVEYLLFALQNVGIPQYKEHYLQIAEVFKTSVPLVRSIIAKRLTSRFNDEPHLQKSFWEVFESVDSGTKSLMINYLDEAPDYVTGILSTKLSSMSKNQLRTFLNHLSEQEKVSAEVQNNLEEFANSENEVFSYLVEEYLEG